MKQSEIQQLLIKFLFWTPKLLIIFYKSREARSERSEGPWVFQIEFSSKKYFRDHELFKKGKKLFRNELREAIIECIYDINGIYGLYGIYSKALFNYWKENIQKHIDMYDCDIALDISLNLK